MGKFFHKVFGVISGEGVLSSGASSDNLAETNKGCQPMVETVVFTEEE